MKVLRAGNDTLRAGNDTLRAGKPKDFNHDFVLNAHITVDKNVLSASLNKTFPFLLFNAVSRLLFCYRRYWSQTSLQEMPRHTTSTVSMAQLTFLSLLLTLNKQDIYFHFVYVSLICRGAGCGSEVERSLMVRSVVGSILQTVDPLSYFSFQSVLHYWCNKCRGMCYPVWVGAYKRTLAVNR